MKVVFDENISPNLVLLLAKCGAPGEIQHTRKAGWNGMDDLTWMRLAISGGFAIITGDRNERTRRLTAADFRKMQARVLMLGSFWDALSIWDRTKWLVSHWDLMYLGLEQLPSGSCCAVSRSGNFKSV